MHGNFTILSGTANRSLAAGVSQLLEQPLGACTVERFPDGEIDVCLDEPVRGRDVYLIQSTCPPVDEHLVELFALADACRRASAANVMAIVPYFGYARADKRNGRRAPVTASMVAAVLQTVGIDHLVTLDLHTPQIEGFFHIPVDTLTAVPALCHAVRKRVPAGAVVVSPDEGRVKMATEYAHRLHTKVVVLHKQRQNGRVTRVTEVIGDVRDRPCLIIDDMISTGGTIAESVDALMKAGARPSMTIVATHGLLVPGARERLSHPAIGEIFVTDSVPAARDAWPQLKIVTLAPLLAAAIRRLAAGESIGDLFSCVIHGGLEEDVCRASVND